MLTGFYATNGAPVKVPGYLGNQSGFLYWDPGHTGPTTGSPSGGNGTWNDSDADWYSPSLSQSQDVVWNNDNGGGIGDTAIFQGTAGGTVTVDASGVSAGSIRFLSGGYTLSDGTITLTDSNTCRTDINSSDRTAGQIDVVAGAPTRSNASFTTPTARRSPPTSA